MGRQGKSTRRRRLPTGLVRRAADGFPTRLEPGGLREAEAKGPSVTSCHLSCALLARVVTHLPIQGDHV